MYGLVISVNAKAQAGIVVLDMESQHYLAKLIGKFIANGCGIQDAYLKAKFTAKLNELKGINSQVVQNFHEEAAGLWFTGEELAGVPASFMARFKQGEEVEHGEPGKQYWVSTKTPFSTPVLRYAKREDTRKKMFYAVKNRLPDNVKLFRQLVLLRDETARLLGYAHHLAMTTSQKTAQTPEFVYSLLNQLRRKVHVAATQNAKELLQLKLASMEKDAALSEDVKVYLWDQMHLAQQQETTRLDQEKVAQYFELHDTFRCILDMIGGLFDTRFVLITPEQQHRLGAGRRLTWHQDVSMYAVWDTRRGDSFLGYAYFDFFSRAGKYSHNGHYATTWVSEISSTWMLLYENN
jgi:metallopeptidase MepB